MKRICCNAFAVLLLALCLPACCEEIEGLVVHEDRLSGIVTIHHVSPDGAEAPWPLVIDCPIPEAAYPPEEIKTGNRFFSKKDMQKALKAAGQSTQGRFGNDRTYSLYEGDWNAKADADITNEEAAAQAVKIGLAYFDALGVEVARTPKNISRPYDLEACMERDTLRLVHAYENPEALIARNRANIKRRLKYAPKQDAYTQVDFEVLTEGMRFTANYSWPTPFPDEPEARTGTATSACVIVSDSGILVHARTDNIKEIKSRKALLEVEYVSLCERLADGMIPGASWQEVLCKALEQEAQSRAPRSQRERVMTSAGECIALPYQRVLIRIVPCMSTIGKDVWIPGFSFSFASEYEDGWRDID